ncbi:ABC transporter ATP-binding protein [Ferrimonas marina]|uniref:Putative ABC transport system ATP-binding protein n=1 Tax=Ferrimonas marina TaxID=299255 RepID=A0A1M5YDY0_9GAMM|nr:ABC transporter ATP-binding protein [Ferrimonas marina]SHI10237.1 putative ABC transport system ATP-binding protein [Ferrimonas marina]
MIRIQSLRFTRQDGDKQRVIFDHLDLEVQQGQHCALLGDSGSGKTTLMNLLAGLEPVQSGQIQVGSHQLARMGPDQLARYRRELGIVFQGFQLLPALTVRHNILLPHRLRYGHDRAPRFTRLVSALGLDHLLDRLPDKLSGGEQQRVAVCRALIHEPTLILADEPTGNLDEANSREVVHQLRSLAQAQNATLLMVTHSQELAAQFPSQLELHQQSLHWRQSAREGQRG